MRRLALVVLVLMLGGSTAASAASKFESTDHAPARVASAAWRTAGELGRQISGVSGELFGCRELRRARFRWHCLVRVERSEGGHYDIVAMLGHSPTLHTDTGAVTFSRDWTAQHFRVAYGADEFRALYGFSAF